MKLPLVSDSMLIMRLDVEIKLVTNNRYKDELEDDSISQYLTRIEGALY